MKREVFLLAALVGLAACRGTLSPLSNRLSIGEEPYLVFVADGEEGLGDLFAAPLQGGESYQVTFTRVDEAAPALSPDGRVLAFTRGVKPGSIGAGRSVVLMHLANGAERAVTDTAAGEPRALAWWPEGTALSVRTDRGIFRLPLPPAPSTLVPEDPARLAAAESLFAVPLGDPPMARVVPCAGGVGVCVEGSGGDVSLLDRAGTGAARWAGDSVVYLAGREWVVRPLGGGRVRALRWNRPRSGLRALTVFPGPQ